VNSREKRLRSLLLEEIEGEPLIFLPHLRKAEDGIATMVKRLATAGVTYAKVDFEKAVAWCEKKTGKTLAPSQRQALKTIEHIASRPSLRQTGSQ
jgi:exodeoxyribonuclease V alpha subunit